MAADAGVVLGDALTLALAAFAHAGPMRRALQALKYAGAARLAPVLARAAEPELRTLLRVTETAVLVPVPVHRDRQRERGYNQAELLARALGRATGLEVRELLERVRPTCTTPSRPLDRVARHRRAP